MLLREAACHLLRRRYDTASLIHDSLGCPCCVSDDTRPEWRDGDGFLHLKPQSARLCLLDDCLGSVKRNITLAFGRVTNLSEDPRWAAERETA